MSVETISKYIVIAASGFVDRMEVCVFVLRVISCLLNKLYSVNRHRVRIACIFVVLIDSELSREKIQKNTYTNIVVTYLCRQTMFPRQTLAPDRKSRAWSTARRTPRHRSPAFRTSVAGCCSCAVGRRSSWTRQLVSAHARKHVYARRAGIFVSSNVWRRTRHAT